MTTRTIAHRIAGQDVVSTDYADVDEPATGEVVARHAVATAADVDAAVTAAAAAFEGWANTSISKRQQVFFAYRELLRSHTDDIAALITQEHGKTLDDARGEVGRGIEV